MITLTYAGIGARATPPSVLTAMTVMAGWLARQGWHLNSGGAAGADSAFAAGAPAGQRTLHLPWSGYNGCAGPDCRVLSPSELQSCLTIAARLHPAWDRCSPAVRKLHARNAAILGVGARPSRRCRRGLDAGRNGHGRHRNGHPHCHRRRHPRAQPGLDDSACGLRAPAGHPPVPFLSLEPEKGVHRAKAR